MEGGPAAAGETAGGGSRRVMEKAGLRYARTVHLDWPEPLPGNEHGDVEYRLLREERDSGATVFLSSHVLSEVERACDQVGIIRAGRLVRVADLAELRRIRFHHVELEFADGSDIPEKAIRHADGVTDVNVEDRIVKCTVHGSFAPLLDALHGAEVTNLVSREPSLEEMFLEYYRERSELPLLP